MRFSRLLSATLLSCLFYAHIAFAQGPSIQQRLAPLPVEEVISQHAFYYHQRITLSPDGQWIVYETQAPGRKDSYLHLTERGSPGSLQGQDIWIANTKTGESKNLTGGPGTNWAPVWSPDGNSIAFFSDRGGRARPWVWEKASGRLRELSDVIPVEGKSPRWTPDSENLLVITLSGGVTIEDEIARQRDISPQDNKGKGDAVTVEVYESSAAAPFSLRDHDQSKEISSRQLADVVMINVSSGRTERLVKGVSPGEDVKVSPDGKNIAFFDYQKKDSELYLNVYNLVRVRLADRQARVIAADVQMDGGDSLSWSPDSSLLGYIAGHFLSDAFRVSSFDVVQGDCFLVSAESGKLRQATTAAHPKFGATRPPLWDARGRNLVFLADNSLWTVSTGDGSARQVAQIPGRTLRDIVSFGQEPGRYWSADGQSAYLLTFDEETKRSGFWKVSLADGRVTKLIEEDRKYTTFARGIWGSQDGRKMIYIAEGPGEPQEVWIAGADFRDARRLTQIHTSLEQYRMGQPRLITWRSDDGEELQGALLLPAGYEQDRRYPLVVYVYGGYALSRWMNQFGGFEPDTFNWQLLATRGYAVLQPDSVIHAGTLMQDLAKSILPGINKAIELGVADPDRIGVMGHSYGGYTTLALIAQSTRFKAAVCYAGFGNLFSTYGDLYEHGYAMWIEYSESQRGDKMGGTPWQYRDRYLENSPFFYLDRVETPLLIIHGADDHPATWIESTFVGLRRLGKDVTYAKYQGEGHVIEGHANRVDSMNRILAWFDSHLKDNTSASAKPAGDQVSGNTGAGGGGLAPRH